MNTYRPLTDWEAGILRKLLEGSFRGRDAIAGQVEQAECRTLDENGSLELRYDGPTRADVTRRIPVEAEAQDADGTTIHFLLHVLDHRITELEIFKEDSSKVMRQVNPFDLSVLTLD